MHHKKKVTDYAVIRVSFCERMKVNRKDKKGEKGEKTKDKKICKKIVKTC